MEALGMILLMLGCMGIGWILGFPLGWMYGFSHGYAKERPNRSTDDAGEV
jgi:hypothetical protein